ncbi:MAG TPA: MarR family transcriptional regulator, partial [Methylomirabilota bacterium]|nr:MarR family transcriptional regulator [Methylomirabilota bacterium]
ADGEIAMGALDRQIGYLLRRAQLVIFSNFFAAFDHFDIKPAQYSVLTVVESNPGIAQGRIAEALGIQKTNFVALVNGLETRGLLVRRSSPSDRRAHSLQLTDAGIALLAELHATAERIEARIVALVGEEAHRELFVPLKTIASARF